MVDTAAEMRRAREDGENQGDSDEHLEEEKTAGVRRRDRRDCSFLDTINRQMLDFDFEKLCSVSISNLNVYACLVCGKYFQGRGRKSHAYTHSLEVSHHVFLNLHTEKVYCLPDGYEVNDPSLDDIRDVLNPKFTKEQVAQLDESKQWGLAVDGTHYLPGMVGLNNMKNNDFVNVTIQSLMRVTPLRDFFLVPENYKHCKSSLVQRFGELTRKIWHRRNFKGQVSPHEFLQAVMEASGKKFRIGEQSDSVQFMMWLLNALHTDLGGTKRSNSSVIYQCFQGELEVIKKVRHQKRVPESDEQRVDSSYGSRTADLEHATPADLEQEVSIIPFLMLGLDLPPPPVFRDVMDKFIPSVSLFTILKKFDGETITEVVKPQGASMTYQIRRLPKYLILNMLRFTKNKFFIEKNLTPVHFPVKNLELEDYLVDQESDKQISKYDLISNLVHDGNDPSQGSYSVFVQRKSEERWYQMQDLHVGGILPPAVTFSETWSESYIQIYEQQS